NGFLGAEWIFLELSYIDLSQFSFDSEGLKNLQNHPGVATVREACKEFGCFGVLNTGIPDDVVQKLESVSHELCAMPSEMKDRAITSNPYDSYNSNSLQGKLLVPNYVGFGFRPRLL
ncbi:hypothetical protein KI387_041511, partial [Taxus chinensis]